MYLDNSRMLIKTVEKKIEKEGRAVKKVKQKLSKNGGSGWESNPPKTLLMPHDGFEVREAHRDSTAPSFVKLSIIY